MTIIGESRAVEGELRASWERRLREGQFSAGVIGSRRLLIFGHEDAPRAFPRLRSLQPGEHYADLLATLAPDERWALGWAERAIANGREVFAVRAEQGTGEPLRAFDPAEPRDILILCP